MFGNLRSASNIRDWRPAGLCYRRLPLQRGKAFLAFSSTYKDKEGKKHSRIRPLLTPGSAVTVPRTQVQYLVTEYGKANMKALSTWGRAEALVGLAHPDFRDELIEAARK
jgi:acyl-CoA hydrolase